MPGLDAGYPKGVGQLHICLNRLQIFLWIRYTFKGDTSVKIVFATSEMISTLKIRMCCNRGSEG